MRRAATSDGKPGGFLRVVPAYGPSFGYTLDLMRHDPDAPNGMTEFLIAATALGARGRGMARLSMNFAMWGRLFDEDVPFTPRATARAAGGRPAQPVLPDRVAARLQRKFAPQWLPRVLAYRHAVDLPRVGLRYAGAEGFLAVPVAGRAAGAPRRRRRRGAVGAGVLTGGRGARQRGRRDRHRHHQHREQQPLRPVDAHLLVEHRPPSATPTSGSPTVMIGSEAPRPPAWNADCDARVPPTAARTSAGVSQAVTSARGPSSSRLTTPFVSAAVRP